MAKILLYLNENPGATIKDLSQVFNVAPVTIRNILYRLKNNGYIEKAGNGYILTSKGEWFISHIILSGEKEEEISSTVKEKTEEGEKESISEKTESTKTSQLEKTRDKILEKISSEDLFKKIEFLEREIENLKRIIENLSREVNRIRKEITIKNTSSEEKKQDRKSEKLPKPIMNIREALETLGPLFDELRMKGCIEVIGSVVVDREFYEEFRKRFPIPIKEVETLSPMEKILLDEMIKDARVIVHAGKYYKLIS